MGTRERSVVEPILKPMTRCTLQSPDRYCVSSGRAVFNFNVSCTIHPHKIFLTKEKRQSYYITKVIVNNFIRK